MKSVWVNIGAIMGRRSRAPPNFDVNKLWTRERTAHYADRGRTWA
jgi:hypothetical protein